jgi:hypothetical protein
MEVILFSVVDGLQTFYYIHYSARTSSCKAFVVKWYCVICLYYCFPVLLKSLDHHSELALL